MIRNFYIFVLFVVFLFVSIIKAFNENIYQENEDLIQNVYQQNQQNILCNCPVHIDRRLGILFRNNFN